jgi:hypothetical protein
VISKKPLERTLSRFAFENRVFIGGKGVFKIDNQPLNFLCPGIPEIERA